MIAFRSHQLNFMKHLIIFLFILTGFKLSAQHTLSLGENSSPKATLSDITWIQGHWRGEAFGGTIEEWWSPPLGDSMMGTFKLVINGQVNFYELFHIQEQEGTLLLQIKHFNNDLTGWETKDETIDFPLVKVEKDEVFFDGFTFKRVAANKIIMYVLVSEGAEEKEEVEFVYTRFTSK